MVISHMRSICPCSAQFATLCARALFRNVQPHSAWRHSARPHSFGHAGVGPHSSPIIAQSGTRSVQCAMLCSVHAFCSRALFTRSVQKRSAAFCSAAFCSATLVRSCWYRSTQWSNHSSVRDDLFSVHMLCSVHTLCSRALFRNVRPHYVWPH